MFRAPDRFRQGRSTFTFHAYTCLSRYSDVMKNRNWCLIFLDRQCRQFFVRHTHDYFADLVCLPLCFYILPLSKDRGEDVMVGFISKISFFMTTSHQNRKLWPPISPIIIFRICSKILHNGSTSYYSHPFSIYEAE